MISFRRAEYDGWRYAAGWRTRRVMDGVRDGWRVERWNGVAWMPSAGCLPSYAAAREHATRMAAEIRRHS